MAGINLTSPAAYTTGFLIADTIAIPGGSNDAVSQMTKVGTATVNAALEIQSTQGALLLPRMTTTQRLALTTVVNGMMVYDSTVGAVLTYSNAGWSSNNSFSVTLTQAQIQGLSATPVQIIPTPGAGFAIVVTQANFVNNFNTAAFAGSGTISLQYGNTGSTNALTGAIANPFIVSASSAMTSAAGSTALLTGTSNKGLFLTASTAFTAGNAASTITVNVQYFIVATNN